jgi:MraZ protein
MGGKMWGMVGKCVPTWGSALFLGEFEHSVDQKGRLAIPVRFREALKDGLVLSRGFDRCLIVYPLAQWTRMSEKLAALPTTQSKVRRINRFTFANAYHHELDKQGRVLIPPPLREYAEIGDEAVVVGAHTYLEIWSKENWMLERALMEEQAWQLAEGIEAWR